MRRTALRLRTLGPSVLGASALAAAVVLVAAALGLDAGTSFAERSRAGTEDADTYPSGDVARARRRAEVPTAAEETAAPRESRPVEPEVRKLRVVDPDRRPIQGVTVQWMGTEGSGREREATDAEGVVEVPARDAESPAVTLFDGRENRTIVLAEPLTETVVADLPLLDFVLIDGTTGRRVEFVSAELEFWCAGVRTELRVDGRTLPGLRLPIGEDREGLVEARVESPPGFATVREIQWWSRVSRRARRVRVVVPVFPAATWTLRAVDEQGVPRDGVSAFTAQLASASGAESDGRDASVDCESTTSGGDGLVEVRRIPRIPVARARFDLRRWPDEASGVGGLQGDSGLHRLDLNPSTTPLDVTVRPWDGAFGGGCGGCSGCGSLAPEHGPTAPIRVRVVAADGSAARGVTVWAGRRLGTTDAEGVASFAEVGVGVVDLVAFAHDFTPTTVQAVVGRDSEIVIREDPLRRVRVTVVDPDGGPVPSVRILPTCEEIPGATGEMLWARTTVAQLVGDLEIATPRTDAAGIVELDVPRGEIRYHATLIGAATTVTSSDDEVRIVLSPPGD